MKFGFDWPSGFEEEDLWKWWTTDDDNNERTDDGPWLYYKLTNEPKGSGETANNPRRICPTKFWGDEGIMKLDSKVLYLKL